ncbi:MAG: type IV secretory system conjugative DNA transfer family protein, partial [Cyanothece sp. SIO1E1]|nr:type IV secretory system conjugative DNA transfer family protein [Cyanothece sp. SIO1E1]
SQRRSVVGPLVATIMHMIVTRNVTRPRERPLVVAMDELPTLYFPDLHQWLNENREDGLVTILGFQNLVQLEKTYGRELARAILGGCATKCIFNPQEYDAARMFSDFLGDEEIHYQQKSRNRGGGKSSTTLSDQDRTRKLFEPSQFLRLPTGKCILINPALATQEEVSIPICKRIKIPRADIQLGQMCSELWETKIRDRLSQRSPQQAPIAADLELRTAYVEELLPEPKKSGVPESPNPQDLMDAYGSYL